MTIEKVIQVLEDGVWWDWLPAAFDMCAETDKAELCDAVEVACKELRKLDADNKPLTIQDLYQMIGEPVYIVCLRPHIYENPPVKWRIVETSILGSIGIWNGDNCLGEREYGTDWVAYRKKPEEEGER